MTKVCSVPNCNKIHASKGFCETHYKRMRKWGTIDPRKCSLCGVAHNTQSEWGICAGKSRSFVKKRRHEYIVYNSMKQRCRDSTDQNYGGRGITICKRWLESFENFYEDMGPRPAGYSIDRINVNGNYEPKNCRWATAKEQGRNTRFNAFIDFEGEKITLMELSERHGLSYQMVHKRYHKYHMRGDQLISKKDFRSEGRNSKKYRIEILDRRANGKVHLVEPA